MHRVRFDFLNAYSSFIPHLRISAPSHCPFSAQLDAVDYFLARPSLLRAVRRQLTACQDTERCLQRLALGRGSPRDLLAVARSIVRARSVHALIAQSAAADGAVSAAVTGAVAGSAPKSESACASGDLRRRVGGDDAAGLSMPGFVPTLSSSSPTATDASRIPHGANTVLSDDDDSATAASEDGSSKQQFDFDAPDDAADAGMAAASASECIAGVPALISAHAQCLSSAELWAWANHIMRGAVHVTMFGVQNDHAQFSNCFLNTSNMPDIHMPQQSVPTRRPTR